jgi:hypothetical protein
MTDFAPLPRETDSVLARGPPQNPMTASLGCAGLRAFPRPRRGGHSNREAIIPAPQNQIVFNLTIDAQDISVRYRPYHIGGIEPYAILEFSSPYHPRRPIPVSRYCSFFAPMHQVEAAPSIEKYACMVALILGQELTVSVGELPGAARGSQS